MTHFGDNVVSFLKTATTKLEGLQVQVALGKAELYEKLEDIKKETKQKINEIKTDINSAVEDKKENYQHVKAKLEHLELQLALGKAETAEELIKQKKKLMEAIKDVKALLTKD
jgi:vacuolar-type H+-ATPase subunit E/Vma4